MKKLTIALWSLLATTSLQAQEVLPVYLDESQPLEQRIEECGLNKADYEWYLDLRRFGTTHHAGFGLGFERMIMYMTGMANIRDILPFPRTPKNAML